jgi:hypothetical protein
MKLVRVFPRRTKATPTDALAFVGPPDMFVEADRVHISVTFSWDIPTAELLEKEWRRIAPVEIGGPATGQRGGNFTPGLYLKNGYVITSRGCPNTCWFCSVWKREGAVRELPITEGWNVLDDNLLACSDAHIRGVFAMLKKQKHRVQFTGGLEPARLRPWHVRELVALKPKEMFFAYDGPEDREPLFEAGKLLLRNGFTRQSHILRAYVLIGYPKDTIAQAETRLTECMAAGFLPMAMLYRDAGDTAGNRDETWAKFQRFWARPASVNLRFREFYAPLAPLKKLPQNLPVATAIALREGK